jgi:Ca-activated chloride channel homolog
MRTFALVSTVIIFVCASSLRAQDKDSDEVVKVDSSLVVLNATIKTGNGTPVSGLTRNLFSVFEDGVEQKIEFFSAESTPFASVILIDTSGSMQERLSMARAAAIRFLDGIRESDSVSIFRFDSKVELVQGFSNSRDVDERVFDLKSYGMTALNDAIVGAAKELSFRPEKRRAIVILSDGADTYSRRSSEFALRAAQEANAVIYAVDMNDARDSRRIQNVGILRSFAEKTGGRFIASPGGAQMREAFEQIVAELGAQYTIAYVPNNSTKDGRWRAIELRVGRKNLEIRTRKGYNAPKFK